MAKKVESKTEHKIQEGVGKAISTSEAFIEKNQNKILIGVGIVALIVLAIMAFRSFYLQPREIQAENAMYKAQEYFAVDSFKLALEGDGANTMGFQEIASKYGMTESGNLANAYSGICYYKLGKYPEAIKYLTQYDGKDIYFKTAVVGLLGDCFAEQGDANKAQSYYKKAVAYKNDLAPIYLKKSGILFETEGNVNEALKMYQEIKDNYATSSEAYDIEKYIARVK